MYKATTQKKDHTYTLEVDLEDSHHLHEEDYPRPPLVLLIGCGILTELVT